MMNYGKGQKASSIERWQIPNMALSDFFFFFAVLFFSRNRAEIRCLPFYFLIYLFSIYYFFIIDTFCFRFVNIKIKVLTLMIYPWTDIFGKYLLRSSPSRFMIDYQILFFFHSFCYSLFLFIFVFIFIFIFLESMTV